MTSPTNDLCKPPNARRGAYREILKSFKSGGCSVCGELAHSCLTAHHANPATKKYEISRVMRTGLSIDIFINELKKCLCLCMNCHAKLHANELVLDVKTHLKMARRRIAHLDITVGKVVNGLEIVSIASGKGSARVSCRCTECNTTQSRHRKELAFRTSGGCSECNNKVQQQSVSV
jgi:hypothetical protein